MILTVIAVITYVHYPKNPVLTLIIFIVLIGEIYTANIKDKDEEEF